MLAPEQREIEKSATKHGFVSNRYTWMAQNCPNFRWHDFIYWKDFPQIWRTKFDSSAPPRLWSIRHHWMCFSHRCLFSLLMYCIILVSATSRDSQQKGGLCEITATSSWTTWRYGELSEADFNWPDMTWYDLILLRPFSSFRGVWPACVFFEVRIARIR